MSGKINKLIVSRKYQLHLMLLPAVVMLAIFSYQPMIGVLMAFQRYIPTKGLFGSRWVGLDNFKYIFLMPDFGRVLYNTVSISLAKMVGGLVVPLTVALMLNEVQNVAYKRVFQTIVYLPYFLSWVILGGIFIDLLSPSTGIINRIIGFIGIKPIFFLGNDSWFPATVVITDVWKNFGFGTVIYMAALTSIDPTLYESAEIDGAGRWAQTAYITIPSIAPTIVLLATLSLGQILNAGFEQIFNLYSPLVYQSGDIVDTFVYRLGLIDRQYSVSAAMGLFKAAISIAFVVTSYKLAAKYANYRIF